MISVPANSNSVSIPMIQTRFFKSKFDSTYPIRLNGIINQNEFQESMNRINRKISFNGILMIGAFIFGLCIIGGVILFLVGGITAINSRTLQFPPLIGVAFALIAFGSILVIIGCYIMQSQRERRMQEAIAEESMKYSTRSPTPCSWRLETTRNPTGEYEHHHNYHLIYHLVIDIGHSISTENEVVLQPIAIVQSEENYRPPSYSG